MLVSRRFCRFRRAEEKIRKSFLEVNDSGFQEVEEWRNGTYFKTIVKANKNNARQKESNVDDPGWLGHREQIKIRCYLQWENTQYG